MPRVYGSLAFKIGIAIIVVEIIVLSTLGFAYLNQFSNSVDKRIEERVQIPGELMDAGLLAFDSIENEEKMRMLVGEELISGLIVGVNLVIYYSLNSECLGKNIANVSYVDDSLFNIHNPRDVVIHKDANVVSVSIIYGSDRQTPRFFVYVEVGTSMARKEKAELTLLFILGSTTTVILTSAIILLSFKFLVFTRVRNTIQVLKQIQDGDLTARVDEPISHDEIGTLQLGVNSMAKELQGYHENLEDARDHLAEQVAERTRDLFEEKQRIETIVETIPNGIMALNSDGSLALANRTFKGLHRDLFREEISNDINIFEAPESYLYDEIRQLISSKEPKPKTIEVIKGLFLQLTAASIEVPSEQPIGVIIESRDVTPFIEFDNLRKQFVSTVSHELRTPITAISLSINNLLKYKEKLTEARQEEMLEMIAESSSVLDQMIRDLLIISRVEAGTLKLQWTDYSPWEVLSAVSKQLDPNRQVKGIAFQLDVSPDIELFGDAKRIGQIFRILLDNAIKYSNERSQIKIEAIDHYQGKYNPEAVDGTLIQVADSGVGIREKDLPHVFDRFYRSDDVREIQGTGLGLTIAKEMILLHHGEIYADSEYGRGSTFSVFLPRIEKSLNE